MAMTSNKKQTAKEAKQVERSVGCFFCVRSFMWRRSPVAVELGCQALLFIIVVTYGRVLLHSFMMPGLGRATMQLQCGLHIEDYVAENVE